MNSVRTHCSSSRRWAFLFQVPFLLVSFALCLAKLEMSYKPKESSLREKLARIDWLGTITLVSAVASLLVAVTLKTAEEMPWSAPLVWGLFSVSIVSSIGFVLAEGRWSTEPIMPLGLLGDRTVLAVCLSNFFISAMAYSMFYNVPIYFMAVRLQSAGEAGAHLMPNSVSELLLLRIFVGADFCLTSDLRLSRKPSCWVVSFLRSYSNY